MSQSRSKHSTRQVDPIADPPDGSEEALCSWAQGDSNSARVAAGPEEDTPLLAWAQTEAERSKQGHLQQIPPQWANTDLKPTEKMPLGPEGSLKQDVWNVSGVGGGGATDLEMDIFSTRRDK